MFARTPGRFRTWEQSAALGANLASQILSLFSEPAFLPMSLLQLATMMSAAMERGSVWAPQIPRAESLRPSSLTPDQCRAAAKVVVTKFGQRSAKTSTAANILQSLVGTPFAALVPTFSPSSAPQLTPRIVCYASETTPTPTVLYVSNQHSISTQWVPTSR